MKIKICGIRTLDHALAAATAGADLIGFVFAPSRRRITPDAAASLAAELRSHQVGRQIQIVGLFVNESPAMISAVAHQVGLDYAQLSGDETPGIVPSLPLPWIKAVRFDGSEQELAWQAAATDAVLLVDAHVPGAYGGTGQRADWTQAAQLAQTHRVLLAGGLTPENVVDAIVAVRPWGVDVSSGVEVDGTKSAERIHAFVAHARRATADVVR
jgi:phosphoribosylanthranilate isomerase